MTPQRQQKLALQLDACEQELSALLQSALHDTAREGDSLFANSAFRPDYLRNHPLSERAESILALSQQSVGLRERLGLSVAQAPGHVFLDACRELADTGNPHRRGPRVLAASLLAALEGKWRHLPHAPASAARLPD